MLLEMGVRLWQPAAAAPPVEAAPPAAAAVRQDPPVQTPAPAPARAAAAPPPAAAPAAPPMRRTAPGPGPADAGSAVLLPAQALYPHADPTQTPPGLGTAWLLVAESLQAHARLAEQGARLLDNMLRALGLHHHPQVYLCSVASAPDAADGGLALPGALDGVLQQLRPAVVLLMGRTAVRHCLGRTEPLGQLRGQPFALAGVPAVVTYDAPLLLRSPALKPAAWEDLCRARALATPAPAAPA
ncbi:MAG: hypothetical protein BGO74_04130 [Burkholderiales bacterium 68-12]|nr:MAG: hypothetical protein BGO74_04130 [Burkholderiales bacterium 68-12]